MVKKRGRYIKVRQPTKRKVYRLRIARLRKLRCLLGRRRLRLNRGNVWRLVDKIRMRGGEEGKKLRLQNKVRFRVVQSARVRKKKKKVGGRGARVTQKQIKRGWLRRKYWGLNNFNSRLRRQKKVFKRGSLAACIFRQRVLIKELRKCIAVCCLLNRFNKGEAVLRQRWVAKGGMHRLLLMFHKFKVRAGRLAKRCGRFGAFVGTGFSANKVRMRRRLFKNIEFQLLSAVKRGVELLKFFSQTRQLEQLFLERQLGKGVRFEMYLQRLYGTISGLWKESLDSGIINRVGKRFDGRSYLRRFWMLKRRRTKRFRVNRSLWTYSYKGVNRTRGDKFKRVYSSRSLLSVVDGLFFWKNMTFCKLREDRQIRKSVWVSRLLRGLERGLEARRLLMGVSLLGGIEGWEWDYFREALKGFYKQNNQFLIGGRISRGVFLGRVVGLICSRAKENRITNFLGLVGGVRRKPKKVKGGLMKRVAGELQNREKQELRRSLRDWIRKGNLKRDWMRKLRRKKIK